MATQTEKFEFAVEVLNSKAGIRGLFVFINDFEKVEKLNTRVYECFLESKVEKEAKDKSLEEVKDKAKEIKEFLDSTGLTLEDFNKMMNYVANTTPKTKAKAKPKQPRENKVYVLEYEHEGQTKRTPLKGIRGRKPADLSAYMESLGLNPYTTEHCLQLAVNPTQAEVDAYEGDASDIVYPQGTEE